MLVASLLAHAANAQERIAGSLGGRNSIGPFLLSLGFVDNDSWELQFTVGRPVAEGSILDELH